MSGNEDPAVKHRDAAMVKLVEAQKALFAACLELSGIHPVVQESDIYQTMNKLAKSLSEVMQKVAKMRVT